MTFEQRIPKEATAEDFEDIGRRTADLFLKPRLGHHPDCVPGDRICGRENNAQEA